MPEKRSFVSPQGTISLSPFSTPVYSALMLKDEPFFSPLPPSFPVLRKILPLLRATKKNPFPLSYLSFFPFIPGEWTNEGFLFLRGGIKRTPVPFLFSDSLPPLKEKGHLIFFFARPPKEERALLPPPGLSPRKIKVLLPSFSGAKEGSFTSPPPLPLPSPPLTQKLPF